MLLSNTNASKASRYPYIDFLLFFLRHRKQYEFYNTLFYKAMIILIFFSVEV